ncbi:MAG: LamG-like jellyroll fold domain-containing protein [Eubacteriales bacterium]
MKNTKKWLTWILFGALTLNLLISCSPNEDTPTTSGTQSNTSASTTSAQTTKEATTPDVTTSQPVTTATDPNPTDPNPTDPVAFNPADLEDLLIWYDFSSLDAADGTEINEVANLAGDLYKAVANGATGSIQADGIGGLPSLSCSKETSYTVEGSETLDFHDFTIVTVIKARTYVNNSDQNQIFSKLAAGDPWDHQWYFNINGDCRFNAGWRDSTGAYMDLGSADAALTMDTTYVLVSSKSGTNSDLYINGNLIGTLVSSVDTVALNQSPIYIGSNGSYSQCMDGLIGEIMLIKGAPSETDLQNLQIYLSNKWSIQMG